MTLYTNNTCYLGLSYLPPVEAVVAHLESHLLLARLSSKAWVLGQENTKHYILL